VCAGSLLLRTHRYSNPKSTEPWVKGARERRGRITRWEKARIVRVIPTTRSRGSRLLLATYSSYNRGRVTADQACVATKARPGHRIEHTHSFFFNARGALASRCVWSRTPGGWPSLLPFRPMPGRPGCYAHGPLMGARGSVSLLCSDRGPRPSRAHARRRKCSIRGVRTPFLRCCWPCCRHDREEGCALCCTVRGACSCARACCVFLARRTLHVRAPFSSFLLRGHHRQPQVWHNARRA
jgi:hypothetical protein